MAIYPALDKLINDLSRGGGIFGPFGFSSQRRLARQVAPTIASAAASLYGADLSAEARKFGSSQARASALETTAQSGRNELAKILEQGEVDTELQRKKAQQARALQRLINTGALDLQARKGSDYISAIKETGFWAQDRDRKLRDLYDSDPIGDLFRGSTWSNQDIFNNYDQ